MTVDLPGAVIRPATDADVPAIAQLIRELAAYERAPQEARASDDDLRRALFGPHPAVFADVAVVDGHLRHRVAPEVEGWLPGNAESEGTGDGEGTADGEVDGEVDGGVEGGVDGEVAGVALWYVSYSTWLGVHGIALEDLFVRPEHRGRGLGRALLAGLARRCVERGYGRLEWSVLDWNEPALRFYRALGAEALGEWTTHRLAGAALHDLAATPATTATTATMSTAATVAGAPETRPAPGAAGTGHA